MENPNGGEVTQGHSAEEVLCIALAFTDTCPERWTNPEPRPAASARKITALVLFVFIVACYIVRIAENIQYANSEAE